MSYVSAVDDRDARHVMDAMNAMDAMDGVNAMSVNILLQIARPPWV